MVKVVQGVQTRYFKYDSLGRLIRVRQPEQEVNANLDLTDNYNTLGQWTAGFAYDILGNVVRATDANGVNIVNEYDKASRVTKRCYTKSNINSTATACAQIPAGDQSTDTPEVTFWYDGKGLVEEAAPINWKKGKLTKVASTVSETRNTQFDNFGRITESRQITDGQTYTSSYVYNLSGALIQETYPSGRTVVNEFEPDGDLARITSKKAAETVYHPYANDFSYTPDGKIASLKLGNGLWESAEFNSRLQVTELNLGHSVGDGGMWSLGYQYGELNQDGTVNTTKNTGNIARQTLSFSGLTQPFIQSYKYDPLYRLTEAKETKNAAQTWIQQFGYDRYGNRTSLYQNVGGVILNTTPAIDANTNRFSDTNSYHFDKNGNLVQDIGQNNQTRTVLFNGDNKQYEVRDANGYTIGRYYYDGEGHRVKKVTDTETVIYVHANGKLVAEYSTAPPPEEPTVNFTATDMLGSPRVLTDSLGHLVSRRDFMPFGEELFADGQNRSSDYKYSTTGADAVRKRFTGYEKDAETGLDFAEARMYENRNARFTAVDPLLASGKSSDAQTFNRYVYAMNNPLRLTDKTGMQSGQEADEPNFFDPPSVSRACDQFGFACHGKFTPIRTTYTYGRGSVTVREYMPSMSSELDWDPKLTGLRVPPPIISEDDAQGVVKGGMSLANTPFKMPVITFAPGSPSVSSLTGIQPFTDQQTETKSWRQWGISQGTQLLGGALLGGAVTKLAGAGAVSSDTASIGQTLLNRVNAQLSANPSLAKTVLSSAEYQAGQNSVRIASMQYGNAVERLFWKAVDGSPRYQRMFGRVGGPNAPDGIFNTGQMFDITTRNPFTVQLHLSRPYSPGMKLLQYDRPSSFTLFK